jgi:hypothetical protein
MPRHEYLSIRFELQSRIIAVGVEGTKVSDDSTLTAKDLAISIGLATNRADG